MPSFLQLFRSKCFTTCFFAFHSEAFRHVLKPLSASIGARRRNSFSSCDGANKTTAETSDRVNQVLKIEVQSKKFVLRYLREEDIPKLLNLRREIGTHDVKSCIQTCLTIDPECIQIVETESGEMIGSAGSMKQSDGSYFGGIYCIREDYRSFGLGNKVLFINMNRSANDSFIGNVSEFLADNRIPQLRKRFCVDLETGFTSNKNITTEPVNPEHLSSHLPKGVTIEPFNKSHLPQVFAYDLALIGYKRERLLELSCQEEDSRTLVAFKDGACVGFGTIKRSCLDAGRVGPLYADDSAVAEVLLRSLIISMPKVSGFAMMTVSDNISAKRLLEKLNCPQTEELVRLYRGKRMNVDHAKVFAHFDLNFTPF